MPGFRGYIFVRFLAAYVLCSIFHGLYSTQFSFNGTVLILDMFYENEGLPGIHGCILVIAPIQIHATRKH